ERAQQVQLIALVSGGQPCATGADDVEDEADVSARGIRPGGAVRPAQDRMRRADGQLEELARADCRGRRRMVQDELDRAGHRNRALDDNGGRKRDAQSRTTPAWTG